MWVMLRTIAGGITQPRAREYNSRHMQVYVGCRPVLCYIYSTYYAPMALKGRQT